ncbi:MAG: integrin alpha [Turneriella sp.]
MRPHLKGSFLSILRLVPLLLIIPAGLQCRRDIGDLLRDKKVVSVKSNTAAQQINTDINGDGYADMVVGAPNGGDPLNAGLVYVLYGSSSGIQNPPTDGCDYTANRCTEIENPADESSGGFSGFGGSYALAGDVNGDGYGDVIVAGPNNGMSNTPAGMVDNRGAVYVFYGSATGVRDHECRSSVCVQPA